MCLEEMLELLDESPKVEAETEENEDDFVDYNSELVSVIRENLKKLNGGNENE